MNDPDICARCAEKYPTCCRISPGQEDSCFPLSRREQERLEQFTGSLPGPAFVQSKNTKPFLRQLHKLFPLDAAALNRLFPLNRMHQRLGVTADGSCVFLGPAGCIVPEDNRPYYCRMHPFWFVGPRLIGFASPSCLALQYHTTPEGLFSLFNTNRPALWDVYSRLRVSWGLKKP